VFDLGEPLEALGPAAPRADTVHSPFLLGRMACTVGPELTAKLIGAAADHYRCVSRGTLRARQSSTAEPGVPRSG
jgi:hypothetical protein